jgi:4-carboxymuconolactone decarboxylase
MTDEKPAVPTVEELFGRAWSRPYCRLRDRLPLTSGASAMLGRPDLLRTQLAGALANQEFTVAQLRERVLHLKYCTGRPDGTTAQAVFGEPVAPQRLAGSA